MFFSWYGAKYFKKMLIKKKLLQPKIIKANKNKKTIEKS